MRFPVGAWLLSLLLFSLPAFADNTADEADLAFTLGNEAFTRGNYNEALRNYFVSYRLVPNKNVLFNIARCFEALERYDEAYRYFNDLLQTDLPDADKQDVQRSLQRLRPRVALLKVSTEPEGADVFINREDLGSRGRAPLSLALPVGKQLVRVKKEGYRPAEQQVSLQKGKEAALSFKLELIVGIISLSGTSGAEVRERADGPVLATVPGELKLPPGRHLLFFSAPKSETKQVLVEVQPEAVTKLEVALEAARLPTGKLVVITNHEGALVRVDGKNSGFTPTVLTLAEGEHTVELSYKDLRPFLQKVHVKADTEDKLNVELRYAPPPVQAASKRLLSVDEAPASTTVISAEELRAFGYTTVADALQAVRGVYLSDDRQYQYLGVRGFSPAGDLNTRILILWDGHAMNDIWAGQGYAGRDLTVDMQEIERIEVVRGPGSALYGTGAFFAVINVVPRDRVESGRNVEVTGGVGALSMAFGHLAGSVGEGDQVATVSAAALNAAGAETTNMADLGVIRGLDFEKVRGGSARARFGDFSVQALINYRDKEVPTAPFNATPGAAGARTVDARGFAELRYDHDWTENNGVSARAYFDGSRYNGYWPYGTGTEDDPSYVAKEGGGADWVGGEGRLRFSPFARNELTFGLEGQYQARIYAEFAEGGPPDVRRRTLLSAYLLDEWKVHPRFTVSAGLRVDRYLDLSVTPVTPRLALIFRPYAEGLTKVVAGTAFRAPNFYEIYYQDGLASQRPALQLNPETIQTVEIEHSHDLTEELRFTVSGYLNRIQNLVVTTQEELAVPECGDPLGSVQCLVNVNLPGTFQALGAEGEIRWQPGRFALVDLSYSYVNLRSIGAELQIDNIPAHLVSGRLMVPLVESAVRLSTQAVYQSRRYSEFSPGGVGEALLLNVGLSGEREHFRYFAGVQNALDQQYALPVNEDYRAPNVPQYGRTFLLQLTATY